MLLGGLLSGNPVDQNVISKKRQDPIPEGRYDPFRPERPFGDVGANGRNVQVIGLNLASWLQRPLSEWSRRAQIGPELACT